MIQIIEYLPTCCKVDNIEYPLVTNFKDWMRFELLILDDEIKNDDKLFLMLEFYERDTPSNIHEAFKGLIWFFNSGKVKEKEDTPTDNSDSKTSERIYDYEKDAALIYAAFFQSYGIDLYNTQYMHWWHFKALFESLPDNTRFSQIMGYRAIDTKGMSTAEQQRYKKLKDLYSLNENNRKAPKTLKEQEDELLERAKRARKRTEEAKLKKQEGK